MEGQLPQAQPQAQESKPVDETALFEVSVDDTPVFSLPESDEKEESQDGVGAEKKQVEQSQETAQESDQEKATVSKDKKFDQLVTEREKQRLRAEELEQKLNELEKKKSEKSSQELIDELDPADFDDYSDYLDKKDALEAELKKKDATPKEPESADGQGMPKLTQEQHIAREILREKISVAENLPQDFKQVVESDDVFITPQMLEALAVCKDPVQVMYYLGKNKEQTNQIANGSAFEQARAIYEIDISGSKPAPSKPPQITGAPDPISPVSGTGDPGRKKISDMSLSEYEQYRNSLEQKSSGWS